MKKVLCVVISVVIMLGVLNTWAFAADDEIIPTVFLTGYSSGQLYLGEGTENEEQAWMPDVADIALTAIKKEPIKFILYVFAALAGFTEPLIEFVKPHIQGIFEKLEMSPDGTSKYDLTAAPSSVEKSRYDVMKENETIPDDTLVRFSPKRIYLLS